MDFFLVEALVVLMSWTLSAVIGNKGCVRLCHSLCQAGTRIQKCIFLSVLDLVISNLYLILSGWIATFYVHSLRRLRPVRSCLMKFWRGLLELDKMDSG